MAIFPGSAIPSAVSAGYEIDNSLRFNNDAYLTRTPGSAGNQNTFTFSCWFKTIRDTGGSTSIIFGSIADSDNRFYIGIPASSVINVYGQTGGGANQINLATNALYRDPGAWYHMVLAVDTTHATASSRLKLYVNGEQVTSFSTETYPAQNYDCKINTTTAMLVGAYGPEGIGNYMNGYMAEVYWVDGTALAPSDFGELDSTTNQWKPLDSDDVKDAVTFGTNGFFQKYNSTELAASFDDSSSGDHTITANGDATNQRPQPHDVTANGDAHLIGPKQGTSLVSLDGSGDYFGSAYSTDFNFGTGDITIEWWMNSKALPAASSSPEHSPIIGYAYYDDPTGSRWNGWGFGVIESSGKQYLFPIGVFSTQVGVWAAPADEVEIPLNEWVHVAFVRVGTAGKLYKNGVLASSWTIGSEQNLNASDAGTGRNLRVGQLDYTDAYFSDLNAYVAGIRVSNSARYTADFSAPTSAFTNDGNTKWLVQDGTDGSQTFTDSSSGSHTVTASGDARWFAPKVGAGAMAFDGTTDYFSTPNTESWDLGTGDFTLEMWVKFREIGGSNEALIANHAGGGNGWQWIYDVNHFELWAQDTTEYVSSTIVLSTNTWYHIAVVRDGDTLRHYVGGAEQGTNAFTETMGNESTPLVIGSYNSSGSGSPHGYFDQIRISKLCRYPDGTTFTPSTTAFTDDINTVLLLNADINQGTWAEDTSTGLAISEDSRMKFDGSGDYLSVPASSDFDFGSGAFTIEGWYNITAQDTNGWALMANGSTGSNGWMVEWDDSNDMYFYWHNGSSEQNPSWSWTSINGVWMHLAIARSGDNIDFWVDGVSQGSQAMSGTITAGTGWTLGYQPGSSNYDFNGYADEQRVSNTARYTLGSDFTPQTRGNPFTTDGNTKLLIHSDYTGGLGADSSGNYNNFSATNLVATDQVLDSPTNNFATLNPLLPAAAAGSIFSEGNLKYRTYKTGGDNVQGEGTIGFISGKWYWEIYLIGFEGSVARRGGIGVGDSIGNGTWTTDCTEAACLTVGNLSGQTHNTTFSGVGDSWSVGAAGDIWCCAFDADAGTFIITKNTALTGSETTGKWTGFATSTVGYRPITVEQSGSDYTEFVYNFGQDSSFAAYKTSGSAAAQDGNGKGDFYYAVPSGYLALCTDNLSDPEIALPGDNFNSVLYTGDGATTQAITGVGFEPDFLWTKKRSATGFHALVDSVRGATNYLSSNSTNSEYDDAEYIASLDSDGFTVGDNTVTNDNTETFVAWNWKAGGTPTATNSAGASNVPTAGSVKINGANSGAALAGTIPATKLSANTTSGFSIVSYTGNGTSGATVAHGLSQAPELLIGKDREATSSWPVFATPLGAGTALILDGTNSSGNSRGYDNALPSTSVITLGGSGDSPGDWTALNTSGNDNVIYCFHSVEGYSKVGKYVGNADPDGPFVYTGFSPSFVMVKGIARSDNWTMWDNKRPGYNVTNQELNADDPAAESANSPDIDFTSNGFKRRDGDMNAAADYLYIAFAESPFKYSNAR